MVGRIAELRTRRAGDKDQDLATSEAGEAEADAQPTTAEEVPVDWIRINARRPAARILQTVKLRAFNPLASEWQRMFGLADAFHSGHRHLDPTDKTRDSVLISWLDRQRYLRGAGLLAPVRVHELDQLGMIWDKHARSWERGHAHAHARAWAAIHGHLAVLAAEKMDGHAVGPWAGRQRKNAKLTAEQDAKLTALDALWRIDPDWNRSYRRMPAYLAAGGILTGPANRTCVDADHDCDRGTDPRSAETAGPNAPVAGRWKPSSPMATTSGRTTTAPPTSRRPAPGRPTAGPPRHRPTTRRRGTRIRGPGYYLVTDLQVAAGHTREQASAAIARIEWDVLDVV
ncbi:helicase associated domain-containing protein [Kitasatospora cineracea]|uniref:helicase associated domain-containing protein n=1 Tax=Kitasatospora cineracea TaxID=88074 RepID=UPI00342DD80C